MKHLCGETLQLVNSKVQHVYSANDLQTTLIVIVSSSRLPFLFLNCLKSTFRTPVHLLWVVHSINIKHNHILRQQTPGLKKPDRAMLCDTVATQWERKDTSQRPVALLLLSASIMKPVNYRNHHRKRGKKTVKSCICLVVWWSDKWLHYLRGFINSGTKSADRKHLVPHLPFFDSSIHLSDFPHFSLSCVGGIKLAICYIQYREMSHLSLKKVCS